VIRFSGTAIDTAGKDVMGTFGPLPAAFKSCAPVRATTL